MSTEDRYIYVAGPMRGYAAYNFPQFFEMTDAVWGTTTTFPKLAGVFNPAWNDMVKNQITHLDPKAAGKYLLNLPGEFDLRAALNDDLSWIAKRATDIVLLPGWEKSKGAQAEVALGRALGLRIWQASRSEFAEHWEFDLLLERDLPPMTDAASVGGGLPGSWSDDTPLLDALEDATTDLNTPSFKRVSNLSFDDDEPLLAFTPPDQVLREMLGEVRTVSASGGEKGVKPEQYQSIPPRAEQELAEHYAKGAVKYGDHNFRKGYEWSKSYSALRRHLRAFWAGEDIDEETGSKHIIAVAWHALTLATFMDEHPEYDDRYQPPNPDSWDGDEEEGGAPFTIAFPGPITGA